MHHDGLKYWQKDGSKYSRGAWCDSYVSDGTSGREYFFLKIIMEAQNSG